MFLACLFPLFPFCLFELTFPLFDDQAKKPAPRAIYVIFLCLVAGIEACTQNGWTESFHQKRTLNVIFLVFSGWDKHLQPKPFKRSIFFSIFQRSAPEPARKRQPFKHLPGSRVAAPFHVCPHRGRGCQIQWLQV